MDASRTHSISVKRSLPSASAAMDGSQKKYRWTGSTAGRPPRPRRRVSRRRGTAGETNRNRREAPGPSSTKLTEGTPTKTEGTPKTKGTPRVRTGRLSPRPRDPSPGRSRRQEGRSPRPLPSTLRRGVSTRNRAYASRREFLPGRRRAPTIGTDATVDTPPRRTPRVPRQLNVRGGRVPLDASPVLLRARFRSHARRRAEITPKHIFCHRRRAASRKPPAGHDDGDWP